MKFPTPDRTHQSSCRLPVVVTQSPSTPTACALLRQYHKSIKKGRNAGKSGFFRARKSQPRWGFHLRRHASGTLKFGRLLVIKLREAFGACASAPLFHDTRPTPFPIRSASLQHQKMPNTCPTPHAARNAQHVINSAENAQKSQKSKWIRPHLRRNINDHHNECPTHAPVRS